jgi:hypothetical protein
MSLLIVRLRSSLRLDLDLNLLIVTVPLNSPVPQNNRNLPHQFP